MALTIWDEPLQISEDCSTQSMTQSHWKMHRKEVHFLYEKSVYVLMLITTLSEEIAHSTVYHHLSQLSVDIQLSGLIKFRED